MFAQKTSPVHRDADDDNKLVSRPGKHFFLSDFWRPTAINCCETIKTKTHLIAATIKAERGCGGREVRI